MGIQAAGRVYEKSHATILRAWATIGQIKPSSGHHRHRQQTNYQKQPCK
jgi:hypothetical protein